MFDVRPFELTSNIQHRTSNVQWEKKNMSDYRFSFGPWNIHEGADPFGPAVRPSVAFAKKLGAYKELGFDGVQFHDDDAVPDVDGKSAAQVSKDAAAMKKRL